MLDIAIAYNRYSFTGQEFLSWLWFISEEKEELLSKIHPEISGLRLGNKISLLNKHQDEQLETLTIKGDEAGLEEGLLALQKGAIVSELNLILSSGDKEWSFNIKGEDIGFSSLKTPETAQIMEKDELEGAMLEKIFLIQKAFDFIDALFLFFVKERTSDLWNTRRQEIIKWIKAD